MTHISCPLKVNYYWGNWPPMLAKQFLSISSPNLSKYSLANGLDKIKPNVFQTLNAEVK